MTLSAQPFLPSLAPPDEVLLMIWLCALAVGLSVIFRATRKRNSETIATLLMLFAFSLGMNAASALFFTSVAPFIFFYLPIWFYSPWSAAAASIIAIMLYVVRKRAQGIYGLLEIIGAVGTMIVVASTKYGSAASRAAALLGAVYFLIRGLDNADKGNLGPQLAGWLRQSGLGSWIVVLLAMASIVLMGWLFALAQRPPVAPPYMMGRFGRFPVSAMKCGSKLVFCDKAAWREHDRLVIAGTLPKQPLKMPPKRERSD